MDNKDLFNKDLLNVYSNKYYGFDKKYYYEFDCNPIKYEDAYWEKKYIKNEDQAFKLINIYNTLYREFQSFVRGKKLIDTMSLVFLFENDIEYMQKLYICYLTDFSSNILDEITDKLIKLSSIVKQYS
jgi:hypothetical protein